MNHAEYLWMPIVCIGILALIGRILYQITKAAVKDALREYDEEKESGHGSQQH